MVKIIFLANFKYPYFLQFLCERRENKALKQFSRLNKTVLGFLKQNKP